MKCTVEDIVGNTVGADVFGLEVGEDVAFVDVGADVFGAEVGEDVAFFAVGADVFGAEVGADVFGAGAQISLPYRSLSPPSPTQPSMAS